MGAPGLRRGSGGGRPEFGVVGVGRFGRLAAALLARAGTVVACDARAIRIEDARAAGFQVGTLAEVARARTVLLCVPIRRLRESVRALAPHLLPGTLLADVGSVKIGPCRTLLEEAPPSVRLLGTHPLFGPDTIGAEASGRGEEDASGRHESETGGGGRAAATAAGSVVLCPLRGVPLRTVRRFLDRLGFAAIVRTPEEHDRDVALTQALVHWLGRTLARLPVAEHEVATSGYRKLLEIAGSTSRDSWELFEDLTRENPFAAKVRRRFLEAWAELEEAAMDGLEVVYRASGMIEAEIVKGYLDAQGIPSELEYESAGKVYGLTMDGLGEVRVRVPADFVEEAREALARRPRDFGSTTDVPPTPAA